MTTATARGTWTRAAALMAAAWLASAVSAARYPPVAVSEARLRAAIPGCTVRLQPVPRMRYTTSIKDAHQIAEGLLKLSAAYPGVLAQYREIRVEPSAYRYAVTYGRGASTWQAAFGSKLVWDDRGELPSTVTHEFGHAIEYRLAALGHAAAVRAHMVKHGGSFGDQRSASAAYERWADGVMHWHHRRGRVGAYEREQQEIIKRGLAKS